MADASIRTCPCAGCGSETVAGDRFCQACGSELRYCGSCGSGVVATDRFCQACGSPVAMQAAVAPPLPAPSGRPRGLVRSVWGDSTRAYGRHFRHLIPSAMIVEAFAVTFQLAWFEIIGRGSIWLLVFLGPGALYLVYFVLAGIHVLEVAEVHAGGPHHGLVHTLRRARPRLPVLVGVGAALWLVIDLLYLVTWIVAFHTSGPAVGLPILGVFLVALTWFMTRSACVSQALMLEGLGPLGALRRSWQLTKGRFWRLWLVVTTTGIATGIVGLVLEAVVMPYVYGSSPDARSLSELGPHDAAGFFSAVVAEGITVPFGLLVGVFIYIHLRRIRELSPAPVAAPAQAAPAAARA